MESVAVVKKCEENISYELQTLPQVEVRVYDRNVLINVQCAKGKGVLVKVLEEIEKLNLSLINSSSMPFGSSILDITLIAQMDGELAMSAKDVEKSLRSFLIQFMGKMLPDENEN